MDSKHRRWTEWLTSLPTLVWLGLFIVVPTVLVFVIAFRPANPYGGIGGGWTLDNIRSLWTPSYLAIAWRTLWISLLTTVICLVLALPTAYSIARASKRWRNRLLMLVIIPFWTSFLVRVFAWKSLLHPEGLIKKALEALGLVGAESTLLYNPTAVVLVMVYTFRRSLSCPSTRPPKNSISGWSRRPATWGLAPSKPSAWFSSRGSAADS